MALRSQQSNFPVALGVRISGVDDSTYSQTGEAFSTIALPEMNTHTELSLQEDDTALVSFSELNTTFYHHSSHTHTHSLCTLVCCAGVRIRKEVSRVHCRQPLREGGVHAFLLNSLW